MDPDSDFREWLIDYANKTPADADRILSNSALLPRGTWEARYRTWLNGQERPGQRMKAEFARWFYATYGTAATPADFTSKEVWRKFGTRTGRIRVTPEQFFKDKWREEFDPSRTDVVMHHTTASPDPRERMRTFIREQFELHGVPREFADDSVCVEYDKGVPTRITSARHGIDLVPRFKFGIAAHAAVEEMTEGQNTMVTSRRELLEMQAAAARQMAAAEAELAKYERFPDEDSVLAEGTVIRFVKRFKEKKSRPAEFRFVGSIDHENKMRHQTVYHDNPQRLNELLAQVEIVPVGELEDVWNEYTYVAVKAGEKWYVTGTKGNHVYDWDGLLKTLVDGHVETIEVMTPTRRYEDGAWVDVDRAAELARNLDATVGQAVEDVAADQPKNA